MQKDKYNEKAINDVYKNAHLAMQSIKDILESVNDTPLKDELKNEYNGYNAIINDVSSYMKRKHIQPKDVNIFKKAMMWGSIKMKTFINQSQNKIADMMIKGSVMGINELTAMYNEKENLDERIIVLVKKLLDLEEGYTENLKKFL